MKLIRDPVHGYIEVPDNILAIVSHPLFQRLRYIKQTALAYMVYPGMTHTRFEHSLGAMHLALEFSKYIKENSHLKYLDKTLMELIATAGLLHDIGHLPFSHTFESALTLAKGVYGMDVPDNGKKTHVKIGIKLISEGIPDIIEKKFSDQGDPVKFLVNVLSESPSSDEERLASLIISNFIDADRGDYLLRDSYYAGVGYGRFDIERLKRFLYLKRGTIAVLRKALPIVEQFLLARMYMFENVYFHSVVGLYNAILTQAIIELLQKGKIKIPEEPGEFLSFDDNYILHQLRSVRSELRDAVLYRKGYKRVKLNATQSCYEQIQGMKNELYSEMVSSRGLFVFHEFNDVPYREEKDEAVYIIDKGEIERLREVSPLIRSLSEIRNFVIGYHDSYSKEAERYVKTLQECITLGP